MLWDMRSWRLTALTTVFKWHWTRIIVRLDSWLESKEEINGIREVFRAHFCREVAAQTDDKRGNGMWKHPCCRAGNSVQTSVALYRLFIAQIYLALAVTGSPCFRAAFCTFEKFTFGITDRDIYSYTSSPHLYIMWSVLLRMHTLRGEYIIHMWGVHIAHITCHIFKLITFNNHSFNCFIYYSY